MLSQLAINDMGLHIYVRAVGVMRVREKGDHKVQSILKSLDSLRNSCGTEERNSLTL